jgi:hypothetical protein
LLYRKIITFNSRTNHSRAVSNNYMTQIQKYLETNYGTDANTSATLLITLTIFFLGLLFQHLLKTIGKYSERRRLRKTFHVALIEFSKQVKKQSEQYDKSSQTFTFDKKSNFEFNRATISTISSLNGLDYNRTFEAFFFGFENTIKFNSKRKFIAFNRIWDSIKSVEFWHEKSFQDVNYFIEKYNEFNERRNDAIEAHRRFFEPIMTQLDGQTVPGDIGRYVQAVDQIHVDWQNFPNRTKPNIVHRYLVVRLRILNRKNLNLTIANRMNNNLLTATMEYQSQSNFLKAQKEQFENYHHSFRNYYRLVNASRNILKNYC